ncbi:P-protein [Stagonosporopsis vannaccii]|nr:P-protein [Stagonosporopsis vannaccii]
MAETQKPKVAFLGPEASYTHQATLDTFSSDQYSLAPQTTIEDVFAAVQDGSVYRGVVPFENSTNGSVVFTLDLFANLHNKYSDILVCGEAYVSVSHCLLGLDSSTDYSKVTKLYSHPQAWGQCKAFLQQYLKHAERFDVSSTSRAAQMVAESKDPSAAAISSKVAGTLFQLSPLAEGINDVSGNQTRFLVLQRKDSSDISAQSSTPRPVPISEKNNDEEDYKTLLLFTLPYTPSNPNPGALAQCLSVFGRHKLNLTSINTRPSGVANWEYIFYIEFKGRKEEGDGGAVNAAFKELDGVSPSHAPTPEGLQPHDYVTSASPPTDLSATAATYQTLSTASQEDASTSHMGAVDALSTSSSFIDWLEAHVGSYDKKRRESEQLRMVESGSKKDAEDESFRQDDTAKSKTECNNANAGKAATRPTDSEPEDLPYTHQLHRKDKGKRKKGRAPAKDTRRSASTTATLSADDVKLAKALDRISENHELTKGLLFHIAQQVSDARKLIFEADARLQETRKDSMYNPDYFTRRLTVDERLARASASLETTTYLFNTLTICSIALQESTLASIFDNAEPWEIHEGLPKDQFSEHPIATDRPAHVPTSVVDMRDRHVFNETYSATPFNEPSSHQT